jgi:hypothetical protein
MRERKNQHELDSSKHRGKKINSQPWILYQVEEVI